MSNETKKYVSSDNLKYTLQRLKVATDQMYAKKVTEEEVMELLAELDIVQPMVDEDGAVLVDSDGKVFIL